METDTVIELIFPMGSRGVAKTGSNTPPSATVTPNEASHHVTRPKRQSPTREISCQVACAVVASARDQQIGRMIPNEQIELLVRQARA